MQQIKVPVVKGTIDSSMAFVGNMEYSQTVDLTWKTAGVIGTVNVVSGDSVKKGDILAELEPDSLSKDVLIAEKTVFDAQKALEDVQASETAKMQAYSQLNSYETALKEAKVAQESLYFPRADQQEKEFAWNDYEIANQEFNYSKQHYDRTVNEQSKGINDPVRLWEFDFYTDNYDALVDAYETWNWVNGSPTDLEYASAETAVESAQMNYDNALEDYFSYGEAAREKDVLAAELTLTVAQNTFNKRYIIAPFDGTISSVTAEEGFYVKKGDTGFHIDDISRIFVPIEVSEIDFEDVYLGQKAEVTLDAISDKVYEGTVYNISDVGEESGNATIFTALVELTEPDEAIKAGMTAEINVITSEKVDALLVPLTAITTEDGINYLSVSTTSGTRKIQVTTGLTSGDIVEISSGDIVEGTEVIVSSISTDALEALGLDASEYPELYLAAAGIPTGMTTVQMPNSGAGAAAAMPAMSDEGQNAPMGEPTAAIVPTEKTESTAAAGTDAAELKNTTAPIPETDETGEATSVPQNQRMGEPPAGMSAPDGKMGEPPAGMSAPDGKMGEPPAGMGAPDGKNEMTTPTPTPETASAATVSK